jgi:hypothetical protein
MATTRCRCQHAILRLADFPGLPIPARNRHFAASAIPLPSSSGEADPLKVERCCPPRVAKSTRLCRLTFQRRTRLRSAISATATVVAGVPPANMGGFATDTAEFVGNADPLFAFSHGGVERGCGVGRGLGVTLGVAVGLADGVGVTVGVGGGVVVAVGVAVGVGVGVGPVPTIWYSTPPE